MVTPAIAICVMFAGVGFALLAIGLVAALVQRGVSTRRTGPEIGAELLQEKMARESSDRRTIARGAWFRGKGWAVERTATYSNEEIRDAFRRRDLAPVWPALVGAVGAILFPLFGGIALVLVPGTRWFGVAFLGIFAYGFFSTIRDIRRGSGGEPS